MPSMRVAFRVDASSVIGTGHLKRCLSLADALKELGAEVLLLVRRLDAVAEVLLAPTHWPVCWLPEPVTDQVVLDIDAPPCAAWAGVGWQEDARQTEALLENISLDWLVVDHYAFDARWHDALREAIGCRVVVIDDVADRLLAPDVLLDHNWAPDHHAKYAGQLTREPYWLVGPRYALLSSAYRSAPRYDFRPEVQSIGIFMGGTDPDGSSVRVLRACRAAGFMGHIEVVSSVMSPYLAGLQEACTSDFGVALTLDESDLCAFFARHDLQIGAGGGATWERCCIGPPVITIAVAANQSAVVSSLASINAVQAASDASLEDDVRKLLSEPAKRRDLSSVATTLVDGRGAQRVALYLMRGELFLRSAAIGDVRLLHAWRNDPVVRAVSRNDEIIPFEHHQYWIEGVLQSQDRWLFVAMVGNVSVGSIRFDSLNADRLEVSLYVDPLLGSLGFGSRMLLAGEEQMRQKLSTPFAVVAVVATGNAVSQKLFKACGYHGGPVQFQKVVDSVSTPSCITL